MSENTLDLGGLLNSLIEHPEMLQKAMNLANTLASSGMLDGLMNGSAEGGQSAASSDTYKAPQNTSPDLSAIGNLLTGLMNDRPSQEKRQNEHAGQSNNPPNARAFDKNDLFSPAQTAGEKEKDRQNQASHRESPHIGHAERIRLLQSLRPFLPADKQEKIDFVIKLLGLLEAAERMGIGKLF